MRVERLAKPVSLLVVLLSALAARGQAIVTATHITGHGQSPVPRFSTLYEHKLVVPAETTHILPADFDYDAIEVSGTLKVSRDYDTRGRVVILQVLPGGRLDFGTRSDPVLRQVDLAIKDVPLLCGTDDAPGPDPEQFGNGINIFGEWVSYGRQLTKTWITCQELAAGDTELTVTEPVNWQVGDALLIPDTRQMNVYPGWNMPPIGPRPESPVTIAAISGNTITLSKPLDFEHRAAAGQLPYVANITRNIVIRSENPQGTRGHTMFMDTAHVNLYYTSFVGLGRTLPKRLDSTDLKNSHIGTNQIARYAVHWHHVHGHSDAQDLTGRLVGCYGEGSDIGKWFCVQHATHDLLIADNVADRFVGASFIAEDGYEVRGRYLRNFACGSKGNGINGKFNVRPDQENAPGSEGSGYWFHGSAHVVTLNVAINNAVGFQVMHMNQVLGKAIPREPGGPNDAHLDPPTAVPLVFDTNMAMSNLRVGFESWHEPHGWIATSFHSYHNGEHGALAGEGEPGELHFRNSRFVNLGGVGTALHTSAAYSGALRFEGGEIEGFQDGLHDVRSSLVIKNVRLKNARYNLKWDNFEHLQQPTLLENVRFERLTPQTEHIVLGRGSPAPGRYGERWSGTGPHYQVINWQGTGKNYFLFENYARREHSAVPANPAKNWFTCPEEGLSVGQCWDKYGLAPGGCAAPEGSVTLDGLVNAVAYEADSIPHGAPRLVLVNPVAMHPANVKNGVIHFAFRKTGDMASSGVYKIDGGRYHAITQSQGHASDYWEGVAIATPGTHTLKTYRTDARGIIAGSELTFTYFVGQRSQQMPQTPGSEAVVQSAEARQGGDSAEEAMK